MHSTQQKGSGRHRVPGALCSPRVSRHAGPGGTSSESFAGWALLHLQPPAPQLGSERPETPGQARSRSGRVASPAPLPPRVCTPNLPAPHGVAGLGRDLQGPPSPNPCSKQAPEPPQEFSNAASLPGSTHSKGGILEGVAVPNRGALHPRTLACTQHLRCWGGTPTHPVSSMPRP